MKSKISSKGAERRLLILHTVLRMIASGGVDSITHRRVAEKAGIALGSTTYYFESREHMIREAFDLYILEVKQSMASLWPNSLTSLRQLVSNLVSWTNREFENQELLLAEYEMVLYAARDPQVATSLHRWDESMASGLADILKKLGVKKPRDVAAILLHMIRGFELDGLSRTEIDTKQLEKRLKLVFADLS